MDFLGEAGDIRDSYVADVDESGRAQQVVYRHVRHASKVCEVQVGETSSEESSKDGEQSYDQDGLEYSRFFGPEVVQRTEQ